MVKKEMVAMLLAGGQGSRLGILTKNNAKPAVSFGGKYRIIDFPMSNCINSGVDTVGVLTQYMPLFLNRHIGIGIPWDLDRQSGGVTVLAPHIKGEKGEWYSGTANAIYQNMPYLEEYSPEYVLILAGDHIYKMDYSNMLKFHKKNGCDATIAVLEVDISEASRFGIMNTDENDCIYEFEEKPEHPKNNLASMGIYIFNWKELKAALIEDHDEHSDSDFGKHIIPKMLGEGKTLYAYRFNDYWKDVGTIESYWQANMELIKSLPEFNLYEDLWPIYTDTVKTQPQYCSESSHVKTSLISAGCEIYGTVINSVLSPGVIVHAGAHVRDSIIMDDCIIHENVTIERCIVDRNSEIGSGTVIGVGDNIPNEKYPHIYDTGITVIGENSTVPADITIGKNCVIYGEALLSDFVGNALPSGAGIVKDGDKI
ncbi:MAG: glucose-1-phosphate adenylyltransferase [Defluviitaleaceae bacterium]|nr:glucose-1-phosphate adenylyltransferase [Defluviitaleaceae bacterium]